VREQWEAHLQADNFPVGIAEQVPITRRIDVVTLAVLAALVAATLWALATTR